MSRSGSAKVIVVVILAVLIGSFFLALYASLSSIKVSVRSFKFKSLDIASAILSRSVDIDLYLDVSGSGPIAIPVKDFAARIYVNDIYMGVIRCFEGFTIPAGGTTTVHAETTIDLGAVSPEDLEKLAVLLTGGEVSIRLEGWVDAIVLFFTVTVPFSHEKYYVVGKVKPLIEAAYWSVYEADPGDSVGFRVVVKNNYKVASLEGVLKVVVREDVAMGMDKDAASYSYYIKLSPGESRELTGSFNVYAEPSTRGFFLKIYWGDDVVYEMPSQYPPRLAVKPMGRLEVVDIYWVVEGSKTFECELGDTVEARIIVRAVEGAVSGSVYVKVRKDMALAPDVDFVVKGFTIELKEGMSDELSVRFTPDEPTSDKVRGYFIELEGLISYTMDSSYPPRLRVYAPVGELALVDAYWVVEGEKTASCKAGDVVEAYVVLKAVGGEVDGYVEVKIKKDRALQPDVDYYAEQFTLKLAEGESTHLVVTFIPDEASSKTLRGYFIELEGAISWTMPSEYPPRLKVYSALEGQLEVVDAYWLVKGVQVSTCKVGDKVEAHVKVRAKGGSVFGSIVMKIRKDLAFMPDEDYVVKTFEIALNQDEELELILTFYPDEASSLTLRGYFIELEGLISWTMESEYPPRLKVES